MDREILTGIFAGMTVFFMLQFSTLFGFPSFNSQFQQEHELILAKLNTGDTAAMLQCKAQSNQLTEMNTALSSTESSLASCKKREQEKFGGLNIFLIVEMTAIGFIMGLLTLYLLNRKKMHYFEKQISITARRLDAILHDEEKVVKDLHLLIEQRRMFVRHSKGSERRRNLSVLRGLEAAKSVIMQKEGSR